MKEKKTYRSNWYEFTPDWSGFHLCYELAGYFSPRPVLQIYFIWGKLFLTMPWHHYKKIEREKTIKEKRADKLNTIAGKKIKKVYQKVTYDECEPPRYGIYFYMNQFGINYGTKTKLFDLPWALTWIRTSALRKDGNWEHDIKGSSKNFWDDNIWGDILFKETYPYKYIKKDGTEQNTLATIKVEEREWRWKWFKWLKITQKIRREIDIQFSNEIGERVGSYKGGVLGTGYEMKKNETPYETLKRMENERRFN